MANRSGTPDPASTLALLWRVSGPERGARGPKASRSIDGVVAAAIELADSGGLAAVSMRRVADVLEMAPMSIYTYVPG
ncbi:MAG: TetR/AcrR family transcriptional regulator, partial [Sciscionella sp.]